MRYLDSLDIDHGTPKMLLDAGADGVFADKSMNFAAIQRNIFSLFNIGTFFNPSRNSDQTMVQQAFISGQTSANRWLLENVANIRSLFGEGSPLIEKLLAFSVEELDVQSTRKLLSFVITAAGATVDGATAKISPLVPSDVIRAIVPEDTPFWLAANNDAPMLSLELASGLNPNMKTENGMTLLHWACAGDAPECVQLLLEAGANKEAGDPQPIFYCMHESSDCLEYMLDAKAGVNTRMTFMRTWFDDSRLPLHYALVANSPSCVEVLVRAGSLVTEKDMRYDDYKQSHMETILGMDPVPVDALRALLAAAGERVLSEKIYDKSPLYWAVESSTVDGVRVLVEAGADVNEKYSRFNNVLEYAEYLVANIPDFNEYNPSCQAIIHYLKSLPFLKLQ